MTTYTTTPGNPRVTDTRHQRINRRAAEHVETALAPFTEPGVRTGIEIVTPEQIETMIDALRLYQSRASDDDHPGPTPVIINPRPTKHTAPDDDQHEEPTE